MSKQFESRLRKVVASDGRYSVEAYRFIYEALDHTMRRLSRRGHVTGLELLEGIRDLALEQFGGLAGMVLELWGVRATSDFGNIVFNLVDAQLMTRTETDSREDFNDVYDFEKVFRIDVVPNPPQA